MATFKVVVRILSSVHSCCPPLMMHYGVIGAVIACMIIYVYNGIRGFVQGTIAKYGFYAFYPVHLFIIHCINSTYFS